MYANMFQNLLLVILHLYCKIITCKDTENIILIKKLNNTQFLLIKIPYSKGVYYDLSKKEKNDNNL